MTMQCRSSRALALAMMSSIGACAGAGGMDKGEPGSITLNLLAPEGARCLSERARNLVNGHEVQRSFELTPGVEQTIDFERVPAGDIELSAFVTATFQDGECVGEVMYEAEPQTLRVGPGERGSVNQRFLGRASLEIDGTFEDIYGEAGGACDSPVNVAIGADASQSDDGWGGGSSKSDLTDGQAGYCDTWARGLAFPGGSSGWAGGQCGWYQVTLDLHSVQTISSARFYHHGDYHIPATYSLEGSLDGSEWFAIEDTSTVREDLMTYVDGCWGATPTEHVFDSVDARFVRYSMNNCEMMFPTSDSHGWLYEAEIFACAVE